MADEIRLVTYANQQVTPQNDAVLTNLETPNNGIIFGCEISIKNASTLHINSGMGVIYGREFEIVDSDISVPLPGAGTELGQLYIHIDLANTSTPVQLLIETGASLTPLVDDANLNVTTGITEYQLATFNVSTATISDLVVTFENTKDIRSELGTADISGIGDGSVKGAISRINSDLSNTKSHIVPDCRNYIPETLLVDLNNPYGPRNSAGYVNTSSTEKPNNCAYAVREVLYIDALHLIVRLTGLATDSTNKIWVNFFNNGTWRGWNEI